jgi:hypothetical protein
LFTTKNNCIIFAAHKSSFFGAIRKMIARLKLKPGQKGTKALVEKYNDDFVCVRYRYDEASRTRIKTVELILERKQLPPSAKNIKNETLVPVQIAYGETELGRLAKAAGGRWDSDVKLWFIKYGNIKDTKLEEHIILDAGAKHTNRKSI